MEVWIPKTLRRASIEATVSVLEDGKEIARLGVDLTVYPLRLPDRPTFRMEYLSPAARCDTGARRRARERRDRRRELPPAALAAEQQAHALALDNRG